MTAIITAPCRLICKKLIPSPSFQLADDLLELRDLLGGELFAPQQRGEELVGRAVVDLVDELVGLRLLHGGLGDE